MFYIHPCRRRKDAIAYFVRAGLEEGHMRNAGEEFSFLQSVIEIISNTYKFFNLGFEFGHIKEVVRQLAQEGMNVKFAVPKFFSETRFPNFSAIVLRGFVENYPAIIRAIVEVQERGRLSGATENEKKKADKSAGLQCKVYSLKFALTVAGVADSYSLFSKTVNILQKVNMLPHMKFDMFEECREEFQVMSSTVRLQDCPACSELLMEPTPQLPPAETVVDSSTDSEIEEVNSDIVEEVEVSDGKKREDKEDEKPKCKWTLLHRHMLEFQNQGTFRNVQMGSLAADPLRPGTRSANTDERNIQLLGVEGILTNVMTRCKGMSDYLHSGLSKVYNAGDKKMIKSVRVVLDLETRLAELRSNHFAYVSSQHSTEFMMAAEVIDPDFDSKYDVLELKLQYRQHLKNLATITSSTDGDKLSSLEIFKLFLSTEKKLYEGCEAVIDIMTQAAVLITSEGIVEGWISVHEHHNPKYRPLSSETSHAELMIAVNGPEVQNSQTVVEEAMTEYWRKMKTPGLQGGHFVRRSSNIKQYCVSSTVDSLFAKPAKVNFMV